MEQYGKSPEQMLEWAEDVIATREPDFIIGDNYLRRWYILPRNAVRNVYLHEINKSDDDRALHDHPWDNVTWVLRGGYTEVTPNGSFERKVGEVIHRKAEDSHRLVVPDNARAITLFSTGPWLREWGFHCPKGWVLWRNFVDDRDTGQVGRGCGEYV